MASQKFKKGSKEFEWFGEFWQMVQMHWVPEDTDEFWEGLADHVGTLYKKYSDAGKLERFCKIMNMAYLDFVEKEYRRGQQR